MQIMQNAEHFVISTRVSARETNNIYKYIKGWKCNFNSRLRKKTNVLVTRPNKTPTYFNSRLRKETNQITLLYSLDCFPFQLTSPQGDEPVYWNEKQEIVLFQFTSPRGNEHLLSSIL